MLLRGSKICRHCGQKLTPGHLSEEKERRNHARSDRLASLSEDNMIIFGPAAKDAKYEITVFTDIDCGYCRKLHSEIAQLNDLGVRVRYVFYPRGGPNTCAEPRLAT